MVTFTFDGILVDNPEGWEETIAKITFDHDTQITSVDYSQQYTFTGNGYQYLYGLYISGSECSIVDVHVFRDGALIISGVIFVTSCRFNESLATVEVKLEDDAFSARIQNNLSVPAVIGTDTSKNGVAISTPTAQSVRVFLQTTGNYLTFGRACYSVHDAFEWFVSWMTDGIVGFRSDFFNSGGTGEVDYVSSGINLTSIEGGHVQGATVDFRTFYNTWRRIRNIGMGFERVAGQPIVRIEHIDHFRTNANYINMLEANSVELSFVQELLYSHVRAGSETTAVDDCFGGDCGAFVDARYYGFDAESFGLTGTCNLDIALELELDRDVIVDGNTIQKALFGEISEESSLVCIQVDIATMRANRSDPLGIGQFWYNDAYRNESVLAAYQDYLNGTLSLFSLVPDLNLFLCSGSSPIGRMAPSGFYQFVAIASSPLWTPLTFNGSAPPTGNTVFYNDTASIVNFGSVLPRIQAGIQCFDAGSRYDDTTGRYSVEYDGVFRFNMRFAFRVESGTPTGSVVVRASVLRYDASNTLISTTTEVIKSDTTLALTVLQPTDIYDSGYLFAGAGDYFTFLVECTTTNPFTTDMVMLDGWIELTESRSVTEAIQTNTNTKNLGVRRTFDYPPSLNVVDQILADPTLQLHVTGRATDATGFIESAEMNLITGKSRFDIITNR